MRVPRRRVTVLGGLVALCAVALILVLPPAAVQTGSVPPQPGYTTVRGAYHIHSVRSDGSGTVDEIATAAGRAGLQFVILTDHGDGTRPPDRPGYRAGVLVIDAVELNTGAGHYVVLGLPAAPYPLAGAPDAVIEDVQRLGGFGIAAHPGSPRTSMSWQAWDAAFDGVEWMNADSEWRDEPWWPIARSLVTLGLRPTASLAALLDRPEGVLSQWDVVTRRRRVVALAGADAHARLGIRARTDPDASGTHLPWPGYELSFRTFSNHVLLDAPMTGNAQADASRLIDALRQGRAFTVIDGLATPGGLQFSGASGTHVAQMGEDLVADGPATLTARMAAPPGTSLVLFRDGQRMRAFSGDFEEQVPGDHPGVYRLEAYLASAGGISPVPWMVSNPIYVGFTRGRDVPQDVDEVPVSRIPARIMEATPELGTGDSSTVAFSRTQRGTMAGDPPAIWTFTLGSGQARGQFAAIRIPVTGGLAASDRVRFSVTSERPVRVWSQLRAPVGDTERWGRTFYADDSTRMVDLRLSDFRPIGVTTTVTPPLDQVDSLLFVVDTLNALPGTMGSITISDVAFVR